ncbi:MAG TPA: twin-arginine translocation signal domain-containing protein [Candidatus Dormibacteraeota bacterium]
MGNEKALSRRVFLTRLGVLGAVAGTSGLLPRLSYASTSPLGLLNVVDLLRPVLDQLSRDTMNGLAVFVVPGPDAYSAAQGTPRPEPGAMEARTPEFLIRSLDNFLPFPQQLARPLTAALQTGLAPTGLRLPSLVISLTGLQVGTVDQALSILLQNNQAVPLSLAVALVLNLAATQVDPAAVNGPFLSPFSRLSFEQKAQAFALLEGGDAALVALLDAQLPQPLHDSVSGVLEFVAGALLEFSGFGSYSEFGVFNTTTRALASRPVGWQLTNYLPQGVVDGWDDFLGYYQNRRSVTG